MEFSLQAGRRGSTLTMSGPGYGNLGFSPEQASSLHKLVARQRGEGKKSKKSKAPVDAQEAAEQAAQALMEKNLAAKWSTTPLVADQFFNPKYKNTFKIGPQEAAMFDFASSTGLEKYNDFMCQAEPPTAPQVLVMQERKLEGEHQLKHIIYFRRVFYRSDDAIGSLADALNKSPPPTPPDAKALQ